MLLPSEVEGVFGFALWNWKGGNGSWGVTLLKDAFLGNEWFDFDTVYFELKRRDHTHTQVFR